MIKENIKILCEKFGYTQSQITEYLKISPAAVTQCETGARPIPASVVSKFALLFSVDEYELYQDSPKPRQLLPAFALPISELHPDDLNSITAFKKIVRNYLHLSSELTKSTEEY